MAPTVDKKAFGARLRNRREQLGLTQARLASLTDYTQQAIQGLEDGSSSRPRGILELAKHLDTSVDYLLYGEDGGVIAVQAKVIRPSGPEQSDVTKVGDGWPDLGGDEWIDVRGVTVGGDDSYFYFGDVIDQVRRPPGIRNAKNVAALNVAGESMIPRFKMGELIYVQERLSAPGDDVVVEMYPENDGDPPKSFLKELVRKSGRRLYCRQHNPASDIEFDMGEVKTVWRVLTLRDLLG